MIDKCIACLKENLDKNTIGINKNYSVKVWIHFTV